MRRFVARCTVVLVVALALVGIGFGLERWEPVANYFSKDGGARQSEPATAAGAPRAGDESGHEAKPGESKGAPPSATAAPPAGTDTAPPATGAAAPATSAARPTGETGEVGAGDESVHPAGDKNDFEKWPALQPAQLIHAFQIMVPIAAGVVVYDQVRRKSKKTKRLGGATRAGPVPA